MASYPFRVSNLFLFASLLTSLLFRLTTVPALAQEATPTPPQTVAELQEQLTTHISQPRFARRSLGRQNCFTRFWKIVFEHNPQKLFSPASNSKLYTVALALDRLGADYRIKTSLYSQRRPDHHGVLKGDLIIYGRGDPPSTRDCMAMTFIRRWNRSSPL